MRTSCLDCVLKHLGQAAVLMDEVDNRGPVYAHHRWLAVGHLAEAEAETNDTALKYRISEARLSIMAGDSPNLLDIIKDVS